LQVGDDDLALASAPLARARTFWRLSARFLELQSPLHGRENLPPPDQESHRPDQDRLKS